MKNITVFGITCKNDLNCENSEDYQNENIKNWVFIRVGNQLSDIVCEKSVYSDELGKNDHGPLF